MEETGTLEPGMDQSTSSAVTHPQTPQDAGRTTTQLARLVLAAFLLTFMSARVLVFLIMSRRVPDLYLHAGGTHVHHLNYGIFLLSMVGAVLIFVRPCGRWMSAATAVYGVGLALTFDEFGMWLHLGGPYWQRASFDAIVVIAALLGLIAFAPSLRRFRPRHWITALVTLVMLGIFTVLLINSFHYAQRTWGPRLMDMESHRPA